MGNQEIIISEDVSDTLLELVAILFNNNYFSYLENAINYVNNIYDFIYTIPTQVHKTNSNPKYGEYYCRYKHSHHTTWLIFFNKAGDRYLIKNITNNHHKNYITFLESII